MQKKEETNKYEIACASEEVQHVRSPHQALFDSIPQSGFKCDIIFLVIKNRIQEEPDYVKKLRVVFQFNITKEGREAVVWTCDTRTSIEGDIYRSPPRQGLKADCVLTVDDDDWVKIMVGKLNPQRAFMMSKFRVKGNIMLLQKLHALWFDLRRKGKTPEIDLVQEIIVDEPLLVGVKCEAMAVELVQRIVKMPYLLEKIDARIQLDILKQGQHVISYTLGLHPGRKPGFKRIYGPGLAATGNQKLEAPVDALLVLEDDDLVLLIYGICGVDEAIKQGRLKVVGDTNIVERAKSLFEQPPIMSKL